MASNANGGAVHVHAGTERFHAAQGAVAVGSGGEVAKVRSAFGQRGQHGVAMRNGFVSGHLDAAGKGFCGVNDLFAHEEILARSVRTPVPPYSL